MLVYSYYNVNLYTLTINTKIYK